MARNSSPSAAIDASVKCTAVVDGTREDLQACLPVEVLDGWQNQVVIQTD